MTRTPVALPFRLPRPPTPLVPKANPPLRESKVRVGGRRKLGIAEFGDPGGHLVLWFHGTPGARRQVPPIGRRTAAAIGLRVVGVERPGVGDSTNHRYGSFADWAPDVAAVADHLGHDRFAVIGLSGGGPYALATAAGLGDRVVGVGVLGGVCPLVGANASPSSGGLIALADRFRVILNPLNPVLGSAVFGLIQPLVPLAHGAIVGMANAMPAGDRAVLRDPEIEAMFIDDIVQGSRRQFSAFANDAVLFGRHWGFELDEVAQPVRWWHGDADNFVPLEHAEKAVASLPKAELFLRPGESHLGGFAAADAVLEVVSEFF